jgi:hypothetical protein
MTQQTPQASAPTSITLLSQAVLQPIRQSPGGGLGSAVRSAWGNGYPTQHREDIDDSATARLLKRKNPK